MKDRSLAQLQSDIIDHLDLDLKLRGDVLKLTGRSDHARCLRSGRRGRCGQCDRRQVVHFNVTTNPYAEWTAQQIINAFPYEEAPRFLIRDRDDIYGDYFTKRVEDMGIEEVLAGNSLSHWWELRRKASDADAARADPAPFPPVDDKP